MSNIYEEAYGTVSDLARRIADKQTISNEGLLHSTFAVYGIVGALDNASFDVLEGDIGGNLRQQYKLDITAQARLYRGLTGDIRY